MTLRVKTKAGTATATQNHKLLDRKQTLRPIMWQSKDKSALSLSHGNRLNRHTHAVTPQKNAPARPSMANVLIIALLIEP